MLPSDLQEPRNGARGYDVMVASQPSKLIVSVRVRLPAPIKSRQTKHPSSDHRLEGCFQPSISAQQVDYDFDHGFHEHECPRFDGVVPTALHFGF